MPLAKAPLSTTRIEPNSIGSRAISGGGFAPLLVLGRWSGPCPVRAGDDTLAASGVVGPVDKCVCKVRVEKCVDRRVCAGASDGVRDATTLWSFRRCEPAAVL